MPLTLANHRLSDLGEGIVARVTALLDTLGAWDRSRLEALGVVPGTAIRVEMRAAAGDPVAYRIRGGLLALRREQSRHIAIEPFVEHVPGL